MCFCFTGHLYSNSRRSVGILDLGGGSTQITFLPRSKVSQTLHMVSKPLTKYNNLIFVNIYWTENHSNCSQELHFLFRPVQQHISTLHTQVNDRRSIHYGFELLHKTKPYKPKTHMSSRSYLGNGLYAARLATLGALGADGRASFSHLPVVCFIFKLSHYV